MITQFTYDLKNAPRKRKSSITYQFTDDPTQVAIEAFIIVWPRIIV